MQEIQSKNEQAKKEKEEREKQWKKDYQKSISTKKKKERKTCKKIMDIYFAEKNLYDVCNKPFILQYAQQKSCSEKNVKNFLLKNTRMKYPLYQIDLSEQPTMIAMGPLTQSIIFAKMN